jgi:hypothetical protein
MKALWIKIIAALPLAETTVLISKGKPALKRGKVRSALLSEIEQLAQSNGISTACIQASGKNKLTFHGIPPHLHQRLRNIWVVNAG